MLILGFGAIFFFNYYTGFLLLLFSRFAVNNDMLFVPRLCEDVVKGEKKNG